MTLAEVLGQDDAVAVLRRALERGRAHHAYRFEGPEGTGKELAAFGFACALLCERGGCGACEICRRVTTLSSSEPSVPLHPDVVLLQRGLYVEVLKNDAGKKLDEKMGISVEQVRRIVLAQVGFAPAEGRARVFIIRDAHDMTPNAANALLKTLEEPRPATHFVLLTSRPDKLLPTIRSRTMPVRFAPLRADVLRRLLEAKGVAPEALDDAVALGEGSVTVALAAADREQVLARKGFIEGFLRAAADKNPARAVELAEKAELDRGAARAELLSLGAHLDRAARRQAAFDPLGAAAMARGFSAVLATATDFEVANAAPTLALTRLMFQLGRSGAARAALRDLESAAPSAR